MILETDRLILRPFRAEDIDGYAAMCHRRSIRVAERLGAVRSGVAEVRGVRNSVYRTVAPV